MDRPLIANRYGLPDNEQKTIDQDKLKVGNLRRSQ